MFNVPVLNMSLNFDVPVLNMSHVLCVLNMSDVSVEHVTYLMCLCWTCHMSDVSVEYVTCLMRLLNMSHV